MRYITLSLATFLFIGCGKSPEQIYTDGTAKYDQGQFRESLEDFSLFREKFPEDSLAPKVLYKMIRINLDFLRDYDAGKKVYNDLTMNYPGSPERLQAEKELEDFPGWLFVRAQSLQKQRRIREALTTLDYLKKAFSDDEILPRVQYTIGDIHMNDLRDFPEALNAYQQVLADYPESIYAPRAKFMMGFIYANLMNNLDSARVKYEEFLSEYPGHELVPSVQFELKFLGKDINSIHELNQVNM